MSAIQTTERNLPALLREAERRVNQHVWGDRLAIVSIPARRDEDVDLLLMEAADEIERLTRYSLIVESYLDRETLKEVWKRWRTDGHPQVTALGEQP